MEEERSGYGERAEGSGKTLWYQVY